MNHLTDPIVVGVTVVFFAFHKQRTELSLWLLTIPVVFMFLHMIKCLAGKWVRMTRSAQGRPRSNSSPHADSPLRMEGRVGGSFPTQILVADESDERLVTRQGLSPRSEGPSPCGVIN